MRDEGFLVNLRGRAVEARRLAAHNSSIGMKLKIRPFKTSIEGVQFEGMIEGEVFRLRLFRHTYPITTPDVGVANVAPSH